MSSPLSTREEGTSFLVWLGKEAETNTSEPATGRIDHAFDMTKYFATTLEKRRGFHLVSENPPPCLQV
jgi:hypothetical protein